MRGSAFWCSLSVLGRVISKQSKALAIHPLQALTFYASERESSFESPSLCPGLDKHQLQGLSPLCRLGCMEPVGSCFVLTQVPSCRCSAGRLVTSYGDVLDAALQLWKLWGGLWLFA